MTLCNSLRRLSALGIAAGGVAPFLILFAQSAFPERRQGQQSSQSQAQQPASQQQQNPQPSPQPPEPSAPKVKKVWTNDDVVSLRSQADVYLAEKEAQEAADAEAASKKVALAKQIREAGLTMKLPSTSEETQRLIKAKEEQIRDLQEGLDRLTGEMPDAPADQKSAMQNQLEMVVSSLQKARVELKVLRDHLTELAKTEANEPAASPPPPPVDPD